MIKTRSHTSDASFASTKAASIRTLQKTLTESSKKEKGHIPKTLIEANPTAQRLALTLESAMKLVRAFITGKGTLGNSDNVAIA